METKKKDDRKLLGSQIEDRILEYIKEKPLEVGDRLPHDPRGGKRSGDERSSAGAERSGNVCQQSDACGG